MLETTPFLIRACTPDEMSNQGQNTKRLRLSKEITVMPEPTLRKTKSTETETKTNHRVMAGGIVYPEKKNRKDAVERIRNCARLFCQVFGGDREENVVLSTSLGGCESG